MKTIIIGLLALPVAAHAGGLAVGEQNAVASGTAGASTARGDDAGAAWYNPAALADDGGWRLGFSLSLAHPSLEARGSDWTTQSQSAWLTPPHLDASVAVDHWAAGVSVGVPFGGGVQWPTMWKGADEAVQSNLQVFRVAPFFAWSFGTLKIAGGVHVDAGRLQVERGLDFIDTQGDVKLDMDGRGYGVDASAHLQPRRDLAIGVAYKSRTTIKFAGGANFTAPDAFSEKTPDQHASTSMTMPDTLTGGIAYDVGAFRMLADVQWTTWHVNKQTVIDFANPNTPQAIQDNHWHDTVSVRAGTEWTHDKLRVRGGVYYDPSPVPTAYLSPAAPDSTRLGATLGASYRVAPAWVADVFGEAMTLLRRDSTDTDSMMASYGGNAVVFGAGVRWTPANGK